VLDGDAHLLAGEESGVFDPEPGELDLGIKLGWFVQVIQITSTAPAT
jgi:hypothetical protein